MKVKDILKVTKGKLLTGNLEEECENPEEREEKINQAIQLIMKK